MDYLSVTKSSYGGEAPYNLYIQRGDLTVMLGLSAEAFADLTDKVRAAACPCEMRAEDIGLPPSANIDDIPF